MKIPLRPHPALQFSSRQSSFNTPSSPFAARFFFGASVLLGLLACGAEGCGDKPSANALRVLDVSPDSQTDSLDTPITVRFDRPAVPLDRVGKALSAAPITLEPAAALAAHWSDRQTLVLAPKSPLSRSTRYRLVFGDALRAQLGKIPDIAFIAGPLRVTRVLGVDLAAAPPDLTFTLTFSAPVLPADAIAHCELASALVPQPPVPLKLAGSLADASAKRDQASDSIALASAARLQQGQQYVLRCDGLPTPVGNVPMPEPFTERVHVYPTLALLAISPSGGNPAPDELELTVTTTTPIEIEELGKYVQLKPSVAGLRDAWVSDDEREGTYKATVSLEAQTEYTLSVVNGLPDRYGQTLSEGMKVAFRTADARPSVKLETGIYALESHAKGYPLWSRNVDDLELQCAAIPKERIVALLTANMSFEPWWDAAGDVIDWKAFGAKPTTTALVTGKVKNKWALTEIDLAERCGKVAGKLGGSGLYLAELRSEKTKAVVIERGYGGYPHRVLANRTDLGVLMKVGPSSGLVWVNKLSTAAPAAGALVTLYDVRGKRVFGGVTDGSGLLRVPGSAELIKAPPAADEEGQSYRDQRMIALVEHEGDLAVVDGSWQDGIQSWNFGVDTDTQGGKARIRGFIQSDRGIYRPGETAHFKGLVREVALGKAPRVPTGERARVHVEDSRGNAVLDKSFALSPFGGFAFDIEVGEQAELGDWYVTAHVEGQSFRESFSVEEVRPVSFEIRSDSQESAIALHDKRALGFTASYLFGAPVARGDVSFGIERRRHYLQFEGYEAYSFEDQASDENFYSWYDGYSESQELVADGTTTTDPKGHFAVVLNEPDAKLDGAWDYLVSVSVSDETAQSVSKRLAITAHSRSHYLGLNPQSWVQTVDEPFVLQTVALDPKGARVETEATLSLKRLTWDCNNTQWNGYRCQRNEKELWSRPVKIAASGAPSEDVTVSQPGEFVLTLTGKDASGRDVLASSSVWVVGDGEAYWGGESSVRMPLVANKKEYAPGETATIVARANIGGSKLLVTTEREGVRDAYVVEPKTSGEGISIPILAAHAPNMFVSIAMIRGRFGEKPEEGPQFQLGTIELKVSAADKRLSVALQTEKEAYEPGEHVRGKLIVTSGGLPVHGEVALSVADEGVLQLIGYKTPDPMAAFYAPFGLGIESSTNWNRVAKLPDPTAEEAEDGSDSGGAPEDRVRSRFVASALWLPMLVTDPQGQASFEFDAPDNLTAFRLMAVAADAGERFGSGEMRIRVTKPLLLQPIVPRFFTQGDTLSVGATVHNYTAVAGTASIEATFVGLTAERRKKSVKLEPGGSARVIFDVKVDRVSEAKVELHSQLGESRDAFVLTVPVIRPLVTENATLAEGKLDTGASYALEWPSGLDANESAIELVADRTGLAGLGPSLRYLVQYPYGCLEQTLSSFVPLLQARELGKSLDLVELRGGKLEHFVQVGLAKVLRHQLDDGLFTLWPGGTSYPHVSVYATHGLLLAKQAKLRVPQAALRRALSGVRTWANAPERTLAPGGETATLAMAAYVLALAGEPDSGLQSRLFDARAALPLYGRALLLRALVSSKGAPDLIAMLLGETLLAIDTDTIWNTDDAYYYMSSKVRDRAIVLSALLELDPNHPRVESLVEELKRSRLEGGYWSNTQENAYALMALAEHAKRSGGGSASLRVLRDGKMLATLSMKGGEARSFRRTLAELGAGELTLEPTGPVYFALRQRRVREVSDNAAVSRGFSVERRYEDLSTGQPIDKVKLGQLVKVKLTARADRSARWVALVDPLPAGFEPVNAKLETEQGAVRGAAAQDAWNWSWSFTAQHDDRALAFADQIDAGTHTHEHVLRATSAGTFTASPAHIEAMYEPTRMASTASALLVVTP